MTLVEWTARFQGSTLLVAPLGWDCFRRLETQDFPVPVRKRLMNPDKNRRLTATGSGL